MASNLKSEEERIRRVLLVGDYIKETGASTRETAAYFSTNFFKISNATVCDYCKRYIALKTNTNDDEALRQRIIENTPKTISDEEVSVRVRKVALLIKEGYTLEKIADILEETFFTVYRDATVRLPQLDVNLAKEISEILKARSIENIQKTNV